MSQPLEHLTERRPAAEDGRSLGELFADLSRETSDLIREELNLAKVEMSQKAASAGKDVGFLAAGGAVLYAGLLALIAAAIVGFGQAGLSWWISALIVGIVVAAIGGFLVWSGINHLKHLGLAPTQTIETLREDGQWMKNKV